MTISTFERNATIAEMAVEIDRRGAVIERLEAERDALKAALVRADVAVNAAYMQADAEWRDHMRVAEKQDKIIADWRAQRRAALSPAQGGE